MCSCGPPHMANQKQDDQLEHTYSSYVMIRDVTLKTCRRRWMIGRRGEERVRDIRASRTTWGWWWLYTYKEYWIDSFSDKSPASFFKASINCFLMHFNRIVKGCYIYKVISVSWCIIIIRYLLLILTKLVYKRYNLLRPVTSHLDNRLNCLKL